MLHHEQTLGSGRNMLVLLLMMMMLLCSACRREERKKKNEALQRTLLRSVYKVVCACASCAHLSLLSDFGLLVNSRHFLKSEAGQGSTERLCSVDLPARGLDGCCRCHHSGDGHEGHAACFCWEWKDFSRHRCAIPNSSAGMFLCLFIFKFCPVKTRKKI